MPPSSSTRAGRKPRSTKPAAASRANDPYVAVALQRGLEVMEILAASRMPMPLAELARRAGLTRGVAFRLLHTLERAGYLSRVDRLPSYRAGGRVLALGFSYLRALGLPELARPVLEKLRDETDASVHLAVLDAREAVYVARLPARSGPATYIDVGERSPAEASAIGWALLASLPTAEIARRFGSAAMATQELQAPHDLPALLARLAAVRADGYAISRGALQPDVLAIAAPLHEADGAPAGAISIALLDAGQSVALPSLIGAVRSAARDVSRALGFDSSAQGAKAPP